MFIVSAAVEIYIVILLFISIKFLLILVIIKARHY